METKHIFFYYANAKANVRDNVQYLHVTHTIRTSVNIDATYMQPSYTAVNFYSLPDGSTKRARYTYIV